MPNHPAAIMGTVTPLDLAGEVGTIYDFTLNEFGDIGEDSDDNACGNVGKEFNPLQELIYNVPNPYADPSRGTIENQTVALPDSGDSFIFKQPKFMQNLAGKNSIIGKSITVKDVTDPDAIVIEGCCVIGEAAPPADPHANAMYAHNHHHPHHQPSPGYGGHGGHHAGGYASRPIQHGNSQHRNGGYGGW